jgi:hypothetical protein
MNGHPSNYRIPLTAVQLASGQRFYHCLLHEKDKRKLMLAFHEFAWSFLVKQPESATATEWTCPYLCYLAARALRDDGSFIPPDVLSPIFAKMKYFCHTAGIIQGDLTKEDYADGMIG